LLDTGAAVNVLPYSLGEQLGFVWEQQRTSIVLSGNLARLPARGIVVSATIAPFAPVRLAFAWTQTDNVRLLLGQANFFKEKTNLMRRFFYMCFLLLLCWLGGCQSGNPVDHNHNGDLALREGQEDQAIAEYSKAIELNPRYTRAYINRGVAFVKKKDYGRAITDEDQALQIEPNNAYALANLAAAQYHVQKYVDALDNTKKALEMNSNLIVARFNLGLIYATMENWDAAQREYEKALKTNDKQALEGSIEQVQLALEGRPESVALKKALDMLQKADSR
jgi:tetratricopeptide (TPR) repeat protein